MAWAAPSTAILRCWTPWQPVNPTRPSPLPTSWSPSSTACSTQWSAGSIRFSSTAISHCRRLAKHAGGTDTMHIVFHGANAGAFSDGFAALLGEPATITTLPDVLATSAQRDDYAQADVIVGIRFDAALPRPSRLRLFHLPAAGYDAVDFAAIPPGAVVCNCFGHETAIAEYVMAALLQ